MPNLPVHMLIFFLIMYLLLIFGIINPEPFLKFSLKIQKIFLKITGVEAELKITPKSIKFVRFWYAFGLLLLSYMLFFGN
ncbi:MAG: hypothetical protein PHR82_05710 [Endomicrobiaceae bacterium]|nr:hypothetical protein [Endomicrobiaceae bacterium]